VYRPAIVLLKLREKDKLVPGVGSETSVVVPRDGAGPTPEASSTEKLVRSWMLSSMIP